MTKIETQIKTENLFAGFCVEKETSDHMIKQEFAAY